MKFIGKNSRFSQKSLLFSCLCFRVYEKIIDKLKLFSYNYQR